MLWRYLYQEFRTVEKRGTVVDVERKRIVVREREVEMEFWDTVGEQKYTQHMHIATSNGKYDYR